ncbi:serotriflin-like isoform X2 [Pyxicephalus adspersus]|uniref:serotriflin-like isoform X2 n=1 Tax=Pyxicephalus adspersus TaxID=30357 RepID=UPI003B5A10EE
MMNLLTPLSCCILVLIISFQEFFCQEEFYSKNSCDNEEIRTFIVNRHNELRSKVQPPPANMLKMKWFDHVALNAQNWAKTCPSGHSKQDFRRTSDWGCGENLFLSNRPIGWFKVMQGWWDENLNFEYGKGAIAVGKVIGHYTQFVWHKSWQIGCAFHYCPGIEMCYIYVCHYCPAGNEKKFISSPYTSGEKCANCTDHCLNGLCTNYCPHEDLYDECGELVDMCDEPEESMEESLRVNFICKETCECKRKK